MNRDGYRDQIVTCDVDISLHSKTHSLLMKYSNGTITQCYAYHYPSLFPVLFLQSLYVPLNFSFITGYGSTLYIGIAMVFVFPPYTWKFTSCFQFQVNLTFNDFTAQNMSKVICVPYISLNYHFWAKL